MSPVSTGEVDARRYGGVNGNEIILTEKRTGKNNKVIEFILRNDSLVAIKLKLFFLCIVLFLSNLTDSFTFVTLSIVALAFQCKRIATSVDFDTLLVVDSVGVQISSKKIFSAFNSSQFLPWTTVEDVFINEVITGQRVLYFLTFIVKEFIDGKERTRLVPLFSEIKPSKECLEYMDNEEFLYKEELLKVIRQIIKCQPSQGQLNTVHLSIAYKHTFWTRQDKMFAMLKFQNREGSTAFSQAFILTISLKDPGVSNEQFISTITEADSNLCNDGHSSPIPCTNSSSNHVTETSPDQNDLTRLHPFSNIENTTTATIDSVSIGLKNITDIGFNGTESMKEIITKQRSKSRMQRRDIRLSFPSETKTYDNSTNPVVGLCNESPRVADNRQNLDWCKYLSSGSVGTNVEKAGGEERIERVVTGSEPNIPRSSDITDQVMEGLMFTIKQDKDNIKVVEQRTKMELDEVLENSEKIETKEGEKCLVNSSLLGLENLLTKIEVPIKQVKNNTTTNSTVKIDEKISSAATLVRDHNGIFEAGFSLLRPTEQEQIAIPIPPTNRIPVLSSLESNGNENVFDKFFPPTNGSVQNQSPKTKLFRLSGDKDVIQRFHQNVIERKRRKLVLGKINSQVNRQPKDIEIREIVENRGNVSNGSTEKNNSCADNDVGHDNNDDNNNNNNDSNNDSNGTSNIIADEVQIDMWKLLQDIARGVKVMVERISDTDIKNATKSQTISTSATGTSMIRRVPTRSTK